MQKTKYYLGTFFRLIRHLRVPFLTLISLFVNQTLYPKNLTRVKFRDGTSFLIRNLMDLWILAETYINKDYEHHGVAISQDWQILDIGAAFGDFSILASQAPNNTVYAIEPLPASCELLQQNLRMNNIENVKVFPLALSSKYSKIEMIVNKANFGNSQSTDSHTSRLTIPAVTLEKFMSDNQIDRFNLVKCDCEGAEYDIFLHLNPKSFARIDRIVMEYHLFQPEFTTQLEQLKNKLTQADFIVQMSPNPVHTNIGFLYAYANR